jgi:CRP/FNR family transcriptional regulator
MDNPAAIAANNGEPYFTELHNADLKRLAQSLSERTFEKGQVIFLEEEACQGLYIVRAGSVKIYKVSPEGREQILRYVDAGGSFNEVAVFDGGSNPANVAALVPTTVWIVPRAPIADLIRRRPEVAQAIIQNLGARLRLMIGLVEDLSFRQVTARLAKLLLETAALQRHKLSRQQMAARLGTVREVIGRSLKQLESRGLIRVERGRIVIVDRSGLEKIV